MKKRDAYSFTANEEQTGFRFTSVGAKGEIVKIVLFSPYGDTWNLAFGDETENSFDDSVVTGNDDLRKVMQTIANIVHDFTEKYPDRKIFIEPVDSRRKLLYNRIFQQKEEEVSRYFYLKGYLFKENIREDYMSTKIYDALRYCTLL